ncbi:MAG TPA: DUF2961 domain-containing protein [Kofleriaceae bacterium]
MRAAVAFLMVAACGDNLDAPNVSEVAVGYDAYRQLDALPRIRIGQRAYMRSTFDRSGGNEAADASHFIRAEADGTFTTLDVAGPGMIVFARTNHWHGSPWHYTIDGTEHVIRESSTATPNQPVVDAVFLPTAALPSPLAVTWAETRGADLDWVPKPFLQGLRISDERTHYGTGYYIFQTFADIDRMSKPLTAWNEQSPPGDVLELFRHAGTDISHAGDEHVATIDVPAQGEAPVLELAGPSMIRSLTIDAASADAVALADVRLTITWDDRALPSVDAPIGLLFAGGSLYNRNRAAVLVAGLLANVRFADDRVHLALYFPMPFRRAARITVRGAGVAVPRVRIAAKSAAHTAALQRDGYFHATFVDHGEPTPGADLVLLDTTTAEGDSEWCGVFAGTSFTFSDRAEFGTLEGDPRFFFDDAKSPQGHGTGTEEWAGGGDYWGLQTSSLPLAGHPTGAASLAGAQEPADAIESAYRFLIADAMPFGRNARIELEHGGDNLSTEHYRTVTYWYGRPSACLVPTDALDVGDPVDEATHHYSADGGERIEVTSMWDGVPSVALESQDGRTATGSSFTVKLDPANQGAMLRRTLDYAIADQRAEVWIADDRDGAPFVYAATWYVAGSTTVVYSNPPGELDAATPIVQTSDRRLRDDELLIPRRLTEGRSAIRIQIRPTGPWSELRYAVYSYVL